MNVGFKLSVLGLYFAIDANCLNREFFARAKLALGKFLLNVRFEIGGNSNIYFIISVFRDRLN